MAWPSSIPTFTALATLPAASLNLLRDALNVVGGSWTSYTPTLGGSTTDPTLGASVLTGRYRAVGKTMDVQITLTIGAGFSPGSGFWLFSYPPGYVPLITVLSSYVGSGMARDVSVPAIYSLTGQYYSAAAFAMIRNDTNGNVGSAAPFVWAAGDMLSVRISSLEMS